MPSVTSVSHCPSRHFNVTVSYNSTTRLLSFFCQRTESTSDNQTFSATHPGRRAVVLLLLTALDRAWTSKLTTGGEMSALGFSAIKRAKAATGKCPTPRRGNVRF